MNITVWTRAHKQQPKCIYIGESPVLPQVGSYLVCREGFGAERVTSVNINLPERTLEVTVANTDTAGAYGECLLETKESKAT